MTYTRVLRWALIIGLCLVPFISFIIADGSLGGIIPNLFFPYITGKNFAFRILVEILLALYVVLAIREPKYRPRSSNLCWAFGGLVVWMALATIFSVDPSKSFWSNFERMDGYITLIHLFALFVIAGAMLTAEKWWEKFFQVSIAASMLQGVYAVLQIFHIFGFAPSSQSGARADTTFGNATYLAVFMLFNLFIALFLLIRERKNRGAWFFYGIAIVLQVIGLYYTETRGTLLGALGGLIIAALYIVWKARDAEWKRLRTCSLWGLGTIVVLVVVFIAAKNTPFVQNSSTLQRFASISLVDRTTVSRFTIWGEAWEGFKQSPKTVVLGWGQENFSFVFNKYYVPSMYDQEQWFDRAHNQFIDWAIDGGLPAFLLYISLFVLAAWAIVRSDLDAPEQAVLLGLLAAYAFNNLLVFDNLMSYAYFAFILAFAHGLSSKKLPGWMFMSRPQGDRAVAVAVPIVLVVLVWGGWMLNGSGIARASTLIDALTTANQNTGAAKDPSENIASFQKALNYGKGLGYQETVEQLFQFASNNIAPSTSVSPTVKEQAYALTRTSADTLMTQRPNDARLELFYGVFLDQFAQYPDALAHLNAGLTDSPQKQQLLFELGATYLAEGDSKDALTPLAAAYNEDTSYNDALIFYATGLYYNGQSAQADALLQARFGTVEYDDQRLLQAWYTTKQYGRVADVYAARVAKDPTDIQSAVAGAILRYFADGNKTAAVAALNTLSAANPSLSTQIQSFVSQLNAGTLKP
jgi:O-antigen ligase